MARRRQVDVTVGEPQILPRQSDMTLEPMVIPVDGPPPSDRASYSTTPREDDPYMSAMLDMITIKSAQKEQERKAKIRQLAQSTADQIYGADPLATTAPRQRRRPSKLPPGYTTSLEHVGSMAGEAGDTPDGKRFYTPYTGAGAGEWMQIRDDEGRNAAEMTALWKALNGVE